MAEEQSPLIQALPPASDYLTYLTIVEYNLSKENLPILHKVLQDEKLTTNIGWDLVHLLVPFLPASEECLQDVARLGNPREVILKATESLRLIEYGPDETEGRDAKLAPESTAGSADDAATNEAPKSLAVNQFISLMKVLSTLHRRIKTKYPSRFLSSTLQAILASFANSTSHREEMALSIVGMVKSIRRIERPAVPSRKSSGNVATKLTLANQPAADPEAGQDSAATPEESAMQLRLFQSFVTHVIEEYLLNLSDEDDVPGMAWCSRLMEELQPERNIPQKETLTNRFASEPRLQLRLECVGALLGLAKDLNVSDADLIAAAQAKDAVHLPYQDEDEPPNSADDIPLSRLGSVLLLSARQAQQVLYHVSPSPSSSLVAIFPTHLEMLKCCLASPEQGTGQLGTEPLALIDAVLALGLLCLDRDAIGEPTSDEQFNEYLQLTALLSSNCPSPNLRGHAHYLTTTILRSHPDDSARLAFIHDTLEHCPFENLKVSAVSWIKGAIIEANPPTPFPHQHTTDSADPASQEDQESGDSLFAKPQTLDSLAPFLFPSLEVDLITTPVREAWVTWQTNVSFYLASLNFLYFLLCAQHLHKPLDVTDLWNSADIAGSFLQPLRDSTERFSHELDAGGALEDEKSDAVLGEITLMEETLQRVTRAVKLLNE